MSIDSIDGIAYIVNSVNGVYRLRMPVTPKDVKMVRINVMLTKSERDAFDFWCRYGKGAGSGVEKISMNRRIRQMMMADALGKVSVSRDAPPITKE